MVKYIAHLLTHSIRSRFSAPDSRANRRPERTGDYNLPSLEWSDNVGVALLPVIRFCPFRNMAMAGFSGALKLTDLDDFITPSQVSIATQFLLF